MKGGDKGELTMTNRRNAQVTARAGVFLSVALWLLILAAAAYGSPSAALVNVDPPTISGTPNQDFAVLPMIFAPKA